VRHNELSLIRVCRVDLSMGCEIGFVEEFGDLCNKLLLATTPDVRKNKEEETNSLKLSTAVKMKLCMDNQALTQITRV
jgi:hypothetical protein